MADNPINAGNLPDYAQLGLSVVGFVAGTGAAFISGMNRAQESKRAAREEAHGLATTLFELKNRYELLETRRSVDVGMSKVDRLCIDAEITNVVAELKVRARRAEELHADRRIKLTTAESLAFATALSNPADPAAEPFWRSVIAAKASPLERLANLQLQGDYLYRLRRPADAEKAFAEARKIIAAEGDDAGRLFRWAILRGNAQCVGQYYADGKESFDFADKCAAAIGGALGQALGAELARYRETYAAYLPG